MAHLSAASHLAQTRPGNKAASGDIKHAVQEERTMLHCNPSADQAAQARKRPLPAPAMGTPGDIKGGLSIAADLR